MFPIKGNDKNLPDNLVSEMGYVTNGANLRITIPLIESFKINFMF